MCSEYIVLKVQFGTIFDDSVISSLLILYSKCFVLQRYHFMVKEVNVRRTD